MCLYLFYVLFPRQGCVICMSKGREKVCSADNPYCSPFNTLSEKRKGPTDRQSGSQKQLRKLNPMFSKKYIYIVIRQYIDRITNLVHLKYFAQQQLRYVNHI